MARDLLAVWRELSGLLTGGAPEERIAPLYDRLMHEPSDEAIERLLFEVGEDAMPCRVEEE